MSPLIRSVSVLLVLSLPACTTVEIGQHVASTDYTDSPKRMVIINNLDASFDESLPDTFAATIVPILASCKVDAVIYTPNTLQLDAEAKLKASLDSHKADTLLLIRQTVRNIFNGDVRSGRYILTLRDITQNRDVWKATMSVGASARLLAERSKTGAKFADQLVRQLAADGVLKFCPPFPPTPA